MIRPGRILDAARGARLLLGALLLAAPPSARAGEPLRVLMVGLRADDQALEHAGLFEADLRTALSRKKEIELIDSEATQRALRAAAVAPPAPFDPAVLQRIGEAASADVVLATTLAREPFYDLVTGVVYKVESGEPWRDAEEYCRCRTVEGREKTADEVAERLFGTGFGLPTRRTILQMGAAAMAAGGLVALLLEALEEERSGPPELPPLPDPPVER